MNDTRIASKAKAQLASFMGKVFTHFSKPETRFVEDCIYGIQASGDAMLSSIVRATDDDIRPIYTEKRLSRNLDSDGIGDSVAAAVLKAGAASVRSDTLLLVDPTEMRKEFAHAMEYLTRVRDASRSSKEGRDVIVNGYHGCMVAACRIGGRRTVPLALRLWSSRAPGFKGENDEVLKVIRAVYAATGGKGTVVYDRGGERHTPLRTASGARSPVSESECARRRTPSPKPPTPRRYSSCRASPSSSTPTTDSRFGRETPKTTSRNALQPLSMRVRRISALKKWVNSSSPEAEPTCSTT